MVIVKVVVVVVRWRVVVVVVAIEMVQAINHVMAAKALAVAAMR